MKDFGGDGAADYDGSDETEDVVVVDVLRGVPKHAMKKADKKAKFLESTFLVRFLMIMRSIFVRVVA